MAGVAKLGFSFKLSAKPNTPLIRNVQEEKNKPKEKEYVTEMEGSKLKGSSIENAPLVIPLIDQAPGYEKPLEKKIKIMNEDEKRYELEKSRKRISLLPKEDRAAAEELLCEATNQSNSEKEEERIIPLLIKNRVPGIEKIIDEDEKFRHDVSSRPDELDVNSDVYEVVPVSQFGEGCLRGMGWNPGDPIGLTNKQHVEPVEFIPRHWRLGLGATPKEQPIPQKKFIKPGDSREPKKMMMVKRDKEGSKNVRTIDEKLVPFKPEGIFSGNWAKVIKGTHSGLFAKILSTNDAPDHIIVTFGSGERGDVPKRYLQYVSEREMKESKLHQQKKKEKSKIKKNYKRKASSRSSSSSRRRSSSSSRSTESYSKKKKTNTRKPKKIWLRPGLMVRIVSKSFAGGRFYRIKVKVLDITSGDKCVVQLDNGQLIEGVRQGKLETVIPNMGEKVIILNGEQIGRKGRVIEKNMSRGEVLVQVDDSIDPYDLEDVCAWVGVN